MAGFFKKYRASDPKLDFLNWDGSGDLDVIRKMSKSRDVLRTEFEKSQQKLDCALVAAKSSHQILRKPARSRNSYRAAMLCQSMDPPSRIDVKSNTQIAADANLFHDAKLSEITLRQVSNNNPKSGCAFSVGIDVLKFSGDYISISFALPEDFWKASEAKDLIKVDLNVQLEAQAECYLRLNTNDGPNVSSITQDINALGKDERITFDPTQLEANPPNTAVWIDLIVNDPEYNQVKINEFAVHRTVKAEI